MILFELLAVLQVQNIRLYSEEVVLTDGMLSSA
jgi:hypothetical protein